MNMRPQWRAANETARKLEEQKQRKAEAWRAKERELIKELLRTKPKKGDSGL